MENAENKPSKRLLLVLPETWHEAMKKESKKKGQSMCSLIRAAVYDKYFSGIETRTASVEEPGDVDK